MTTNYDLTVPGMAKVLADDLVKITDENAEIDNPPRHSWRVGPSSLGDDCTAKLWYKFRWAKKEKIEGRMTRLFKKGHDDESGLVDILRRMGWTVHDVDPARVEANKPNPQFKMSDFAGHLSGYLDGVGSHPLFTQGLWVLVEFKGFNTKRFNAWKSKGVRVSDHKYYVQECVYMKTYELPWCLMMGINKETSEIHYEVVMRNDGVADEALRRAYTIINSPTRPARIAENGAHHKCKFCHLAGVCHYGEPVEISCRSCVNCVPIEGGQFACQLYGPIPNMEAIQTACGHHTPIK